MAFSALSSCSIPSFWYLLATTWCEQIGIQLKYEVFNKNHYIYLYFKQINEKYCNSYWAFQFHHCGIKNLIRIFIFTFMSNKYDFSEDTNMAWNVMKCYLFMVTDKSLLCPTYAMEPLGSDSVVAPDNSCARSEIKSKFYETFDDWKWEEVPLPVRLLLRVQQYSAVLEYSKL